MEFFFSEPQQEVSAPAYSIMNLSSMILFKGNSASTTCIGSLNLRRSPSIYRRQSARKVLFCGNGLPIMSLLHSILTVALQATNQPTRYRREFCLRQGMAEISNTIPILCPHLRDIHPMHRTLQQPVRPVAEQISYVNHDRREGIVFCTGRVYWDGRPTCVRILYFQPGL